MKTPRHLSQAILGSLALMTICATGFGAPLPVESPVGSFGFDAPADPPSGPPQITPMVFLNGPYSDSIYLPGATTYMTMDESGKVTAVSQVPGYTDKKETTGVTRILYVRTVNGLPVLTANASAGGMYNDGTEESSTSGRGKATIPFGSSTTNGSIQEVPVMSSFSGKMERNSENEKPHMDTLELDATQLGGLVEKSWGMYLDISEHLDSKGKPFYSAYAYLYNANGTNTGFGYKTVKYSATGGYTISFSKGLLYDSDFDPILDAKGKQVVDKNSQIKFTNLMLKKLFDSSANNAPYWQPAAGTVNYKFLGQNGVGQVFNFDITNFHNASARSALSAK